MSDLRGFPQLVKTAAIDAFEIAKVALRGWIADRAASMGAAIAYYTVFSMAPILLLVIAVAGIVFGDKAAAGALVENLTDVMGKDGAQALEALVKHAAIGASGPIATLVGIVTMLVAATAVLAELQTALKVIWKDTPKPGRQIIAAVKHRLLCLAIIVASGALLAASLAASTAITAFSGYLAAAHVALPHVLGVINVALTLAVTTVLFGMIFKVLPDAPIRWGDVWVGAALTSVLFAVGKHLLSLYIGGKNVTSVYGAAGALVIVLLWVYYSTQILLFGAEIAKAYAERRKARHGTQTAVDPPGNARLDTPPNAL